MSARVNWAAPPRTGRPILLCLPYAGGDGVAFQPWQASLGSRVSVAWAELPGRGGHFGAPALRSIAAQVDWLLPEVMRMPQPLAIFGYSMGALTGFELAHALRDAGNPGPALLMVAAHGPPEAAQEGPALHAMAEPDLVRQLGEIAGTPDGVLEHAELLALLLPRLRADFAACETYRPVVRRPLDVPMVAYGGADDSDVPPGALLRWAPLTRGRFDCVLLGGGHFFLHGDRQRLLADIAGRLPGA